MVKKYLLDIISIILVSTIAVFATQKPAMDLKLHPSIDDKGKLPDVKREEKEKVQMGIIKEVTALGSIKERNIFSLDGGYTKLGTGLKGPLPENPYTLIGILYGEEKKAVFRDYTSSIIVLTVGEKLVDGSVITNIERLSVQLEKGKEKKELKVFDLTNPNRRAPPKPEIRPRPERMAPQKPGQEIRPRPERMAPQKPGQEIRPRSEQGSRQRPERAPRQQQRK
jgi:hypothetical protein